MNNLILQFGAEVKALLNHFGHLDHKAAAKVLTDTAAELTAAGASVAVHTPSGQASVAKVVATLPPASATTPTPTVVPPAPPLTQQAAPAPASGSAGAATSGTAAKTS